MDLIDKNMAIDICNSAIDLWHGQLGEGALVAVKEGIEGLPSAEPVKAYTKADYIMALHKEYGCTLCSAEEAHNKALEYLRSKARMKG